MSFLVFPSEMNLLLIPSLLVDMNSVMNSPVCWQDDDKFAPGNADRFLESAFPLCPPVELSAVIVQVLIGGDLLGYQIYLARFAPVAPPSSLCCRMSSPR